MDTLVIKLFVLIVFAIGVALFVMGLRIYIDAKPDQKELKESAKWVWMIGLCITLLGMIGIIALFVANENKMPVLLIMMGLGLFGLSVTLKEHIGKEGWEESYTNIVLMLGLLFVFAGVLFKINTIPVKLYAGLMVVLGIMLIVFGFIISAKLSSDNKNIFKTYSVVILAMGFALLTMGGTVLGIEFTSKKDPTVANAEQKVNQAEQKVERAPPAQQQQAQQILFEAKQNLHEAEVDAGQALNLGGFHERLAGMKQKVNKGTKGKGEQCEKNDECYYGTCKKFRLPGGTKDQHACYEDDDV